MSGLELTAAAILGAAYLESKWLLYKDLRMVIGALMVGTSTVLAEKSGKLNLFYVFENYAKSQPNSIALVYPRPKPGPITTGDDAFCLETYTYKQLYDIVLKYAHILRFEYDVKQDDIVALDCVNKSEFIFIWLALWSVGAKPAFINYNLKDHSLVHCVRAANTRLLLVDEEIAENVLPVEDEIRNIKTTADNTSTIRTRTSGDKGDDCIHRNEAVANDTGIENTQVVYLNKYFYQQVENSPPYRAPDSERNPNDKRWGTAMLIYTSGTTGLPKAAVMSWHKAIIGAGSYAHANRITKNDIIYSSMPLYHSTASVLGFLDALYIGGGFAIGHKFSTSTFWTQVKLSKATGIQYVGETCRYLFNAPFHPDERSHSLRFAIGNGLRPDVWAKFKERFNIPIIGEFYGATEFPTATTNLQMGEYAVGAVSNYGKCLQLALNYLRFTIVAVDPNDSTEIWRNPKTGLGRKAKVGEPGEFIFKINASRIHESFQGYTNDKSATERKVLRNVLKYGDAYVRSGDLLRFDDQGLIFFVDRIGDSFRWKSENVSTNEVEEVISSHGGIHQVVVVGVKVPNHEGRAGFAVIHPSNYNAPPDLSSLASHILSKLPRYAVPVFIKFVPEIETTGNNKIQKVRYRNQKIPSNDETEVIYWLKDDTYVPLSHDDWSLVTAGSSRL